MDHDDTVRSISDEVMPLLSRSWDSVEDGFRLQGMRRQIAKEWGTVFWQLDNLAHLAGWFVIDCHKDTNKNGNEFALRVMPTSLGIDPQCIRYHQSVARGAH